MSTKLRLTTKTDQSKQRPASSKRKPTAVPSGDAYDQLTLEIERGDSLAGLLSEQLSIFSQRPDAPYQLFALSVLADAVIDKFDAIHQHARTLHAEWEKTGGAR